MGISGYSYGSYIPFPNDRPKEFTPSNVRAKMEALTQDELTLVLNESYAESTRRNLVKNEAVLAERRNKMAQGWREFSNFLTGVVHALSTHRMLQRHCAGSGAGYALNSGFKIGEVEPPGSFWGPMAIIAARKGYLGAYRARRRDKANNLPFSDLPPWERTASEHKAFIAAKLLLEPAAVGPYQKEKAPAVKQEPSKSTDLPKWMW